MKFLHISDLHIGKRLHGFSLEEDQKYILDQIVDIAEENKVDALIVAGDVYDVGIPSESAMNIFDAWINKLIDKKIAVYIISGNHDSRNRLGFGRKIFEKSGVHLVTEYGGRIETFSLDDEYGQVKIYMLPFLKVRDLRQHFPDRKLVTIDEGMRAVIERENIDPAERNILVAHQYVDGGVTSDSEEIVIGGLEEIHPRIFSDFSYVALGHLHKPQTMGGENIRYSGSILRYSKSEAASEDQESKLCILVDIDGSGKAKCQPIDLIPMRDLITIQGDFKDLIEFAQTGQASDQGIDKCFIYFELTDQHPIPEVMARLRDAYPNTLAMNYINRESMKAAKKTKASSLSRDPRENIEDFFEAIRQRKMDDRELEIVDQILDEIRDGEAGGQEVRR